jgi:mono/diheme cytochrome c family protein
MIKGACGIRPETCDTGHRLKTMKVLEFGRIPFAEQWIAYLRAHLRNVGGRKNMKRASFLAVILLLSCGLAAWSQGQPAGTTQEKTIKKVPIKQTSAYSGEEMFGAYCAVCHGKQGKGDGPAASALKTPPADLSTLAKRNNGKFPTDRVNATLRFGVPTPAHGTADMPIWSGLFSELEGKTGTGGVVQLRIFNLTQYVESLQTK